VVIRLGIGAAALALLVIGVLLVRMLMPPATPTKRPQVAVAVAASALRLDLEPADASVYLDGQAVSARPGEGLDSLSPGTRVLRIVKPGFVSFEQIVDLRPGKVRRVTLRLQVETPKLP
jgi:hypothetical protein